VDIDPNLKSALKRFQIIAYIVSVLLIILMFVAVPLNHLWGQPALSAAISPVHGLGYMIYLAMAFDLARRANWQLWPRMVGLLLAGTVPIVSIIVERWCTRTIRSEGVLPKPGDAESAAATESAS